MSLDSTTTFPSPENEYDVLQHPNEPWSEVYRRAGYKWRDLEAAAQLLEETKSSLMAQKQTALGGDLPVNRAEQTVKASPDWMEHLRKIVEARKKANGAKIDLEYCRMKFNEWQSAEANHRIEAKL